VLDHTWIYIVHEEKNTSSGGKANNRIPKYHCVFDHKLNHSIIELEIRSKYEWKKLTTELSHRQWVMDMLTMNSCVLREVREVDRQQTLTIFHGWKIRNHKGGNYKVVPAQNIIMSDANSPSSSIGGPFLRNAQTFTGWQNVLVM
jgi:hypothetical protein